MEEYSRKIFTITRCYGSSNRRKSMCTSSRAARTLQEWASRVCLRSPRLWRTQSSRRLANAFAACQFAQVTSRRRERNHDCIHGERKTPALEKRTGHNSRARNLRVWRGCGLVRYFMDSSCCQARRKCLSRRFPADLSCLNLAALPELSSRRRCTSSGRRQSCASSERNTGQGRPRGVRHAMRYMPSSDESSWRAHAARQSEVGADFPRAQNGVCWTLSRRALQADQRCEAEWRTIPRRTSSPLRGRRSCPLGLEPRGRPHIAASLPVPNPAPGESLNSWPPTLPRL